MTSRTLVAHTVICIYLRMMLNSTEHPNDQEFLQLAINALHQWSKKWMLSLNSNKRQVVSYGRTIDTSTVYTIMDQNQQVVPLARLDKIKDIGVYFDTRLEYKDHMLEKNKQGIYDVRLN